MSVSGLFVAATVISPPLPQPPRTPIRSSLTAAAYLIKLSTGNRGRQEGAAGRNTNQEPRGPLAALPARLAAAISQAVQVTEINGNG